MAVVTDNLASIDPDISTRWGGAVHLDPRLIPDSRG